MTLRDDLKARARRLNTEAYALYLAARHPDTPWYAKAFVAAVAAYVFSPIDPIPDFIPVIGYLDELVLVPIAVVIAIRLVPEHVMVESRLNAEDAFRDGKPVSRAAAVTIVVVWVALAVLGVTVIARLLRR